MREVEDFLRSVSGPRYNLGLLNSSPNVSAPVGLNGYEQKPTQTAQASSSPAQSGQAYQGSLLGNPTAVNDVVSQGINTFGNGHGLSSSWDGTSGKIGIGQGATTDANQSFYTDKAIKDFAMGMNYTPLGAFKAVAKNGIAYNMNNQDILGMLNNPNNGYGDPIAALAAIQGWSGDGVALNSPSMASNPMQQDPATAQQRALAEALTRGGGGGNGSGYSDRSNSMNSGTGSNAPGGF